MSIIKICEYGSYKLAQIAIGMVNQTFVGAYIHNSQIQSSFIYEILHQQHLHKKVNPLLDKLYIHSHGKVTDRKLENFQFKINKCLNLLFPLEH